MIDSPFSRIDDDVILALVSGVGAQKETSRRFRPGAAGLALLPKHMFDNAERPSWRLLGGRLGPREARTSQGGTVEGTGLTSVAKHSVSPPRRLARLERRQKIVAATESWIDSKQTRPRESAEERLQATLVKPMPLRKSVKRWGFCRDCCDMYSGSHVREKPRVSEAFPVLRLVAADASGSAAASRATAGGAAHAAAS